MNQFKQHYQMQAMECALKHDAAVLRENKHEAEMWRKETLRYEKMANEIED